MADEAAEAEPQDCIGTRGAAERGLLLETREVTDGIAPYVAHFTQLVASSGSTAACSEVRWQPIVGCPGRYVLHPTCRRRLSEVHPQVLLGLPVCVETTSDACRDPLLVLPFAAPLCGGVISYVKSTTHGATVTTWYCHTLNNASGWLRKLHALHVSVPPPPD
eukprot:TRINITY_DN31819_c0_g1_i1.p1 TRINITY_DN31819_c0_g1~~TRINITY_DN31819_c0_g1_i1.p1  ORF type:complete len:163 (+),score=20.01 TRINITY_DN31819_c0_g1_i1:48-536(+)